MSGEALSFAGVTHNYGQRAALSDVTLAVRSGEMFGLIGPDGVAALARQAHVRAIAEQLHVVHAGQPDPDRTRAPARWRAATSRTPAGSPSSFPRRRVR